MRKLWSTLALLMLAATFAGCGGTDAFSTPGSGGASTLSVATLSVVSSAATLPPDGTTATITVTATDKNNVAVSGATINFATSSGTLAVTSGTTDGSGHATAKLSAQGLAAATVITVTATSGAVTGKTTVTVANTQQTLTLSTDVPQIPSAAGNTPATIKALLVDANNNVISGAPVSFQATSGALTVTQGTTDATGTAIATLSAGTSAQNRTITVTATSGSSMATIQIQVVGTALTVSGPTSLVQGTSATYTVTLVDSGGNGIVGQTIALSSSLGNTLAPASVTTGTTGSATFTYTAANAGTDTITASAYAAAMSATEQVSISNQNFTITAPASGTSIPVGQANAVPVTISWTAGGAGQSGTVNFSSSRGTVSPTSVTVTGGVMQSAVTLYSPTAGPANLSATAVQSGVTVATAQTSVSFVAPVSTAAAVSVQANPSAVPTQGTSTVVATVVDGSTPNPNPVQGATVNFTLTDATGGTLSAGSAVTNSQGQATVTYTASTGSSTPNGVTIQVQVLGTNITNSTTLTVGGQTVFLSLGTGNNVVEYSLTQYELPYTVQAVDASGHGLSGVTVTFSLQSTGYLMGSMATYVSPSWLNGLIYTSTPEVCPNTQVYENNGTIETSVPNPVPPNWVLTAIPGSVASTDVSSGSTSAAGTATVNLIYPKDHAVWVQVALTATATVSGTQNSTTASFILPGAGPDYANQSQSPPGQFSPYGSNTTCY